MTWSHTPSHLLISPQTKAKCIVLCSPARHSSYVLHSLIITATFLEFSVHSFYTWVIPILQDTVSCIVIPTSSCVLLSRWKLLLIRPNPIKKYEHLPESFLLRRPHYPTCVLNVVFVHFWVFSHLLLSSLCRWAHLQHLVLLFATNHFRARQCVLSFHPITYHDTVSCYFSLIVT